MNPTHKRWIPLPLIFQRESRNDGFIIKRLWRRRNFSKVAKIVRNKIFNNEYESGHNIPLTGSLMSMILYGKEINSDIAETNVCKALSQLTKEKV